MATYSSPSNRAAGEHAQDLPIKTAGIKKPGEGAGLKQYQQHTSAQAVCHKTQRRMRLKSRIVALAIDGKLSPHDAHQALVLSRLVSA